MCRKHFRTPLFLRNLSTQTKMWIGIAVLALFSPLGIILPAKFKAGDAWGEWGTDEIEKMLGYVPQGMKKLAERWHAPFQDYDFRGWDQMGLGMQSIGYIFSAVAGIAVIIAVIIVLGKIAAKDE
ncbi:MAG TPA: PDGLE domain-containing protein [Geobacteraceae bacterium]|nr:PDGLE domain-containing protein [Geobacteraceae bacterium]